MEGKFPRLPVDKVDPSAVERRCPEGGLQAKLQRRTDRRHAVELLSEIPLQLDEPSLA